MRLSTIGPSVELKEFAIIKMEASSEVNIFLKSECLGVIPPRLPQDHSPSGEPHCRALVQTSRGSGEPLVNRPEPCHSLGRQRIHLCSSQSRQMAVYGQALKASGLHQHAGSYYLNDPRPLRILEGNRSQNHVTLLINFPSECAALEFWNSPVYNQKIRPLRKNAGDYTIELYRLL